MSSIHMTTEAIAATIKDEAVRLRFLLDTMTFEQAKTACRFFGASLKRTGFDYRVSHHLQPGEAAAYYTDDLADAVDTAAAIDRAMADGEIVFKAPVG